MLKITEEKYYRTHTDYRGIWDTERRDWPNWEEIKHQYMGKRTLLTNQDGATVLLIEGLHLEIISEKKPKT